MNDTTVWCQNASVTEPQRDNWHRQVTDEGEPPAGGVIHLKKDGRFASYPSSTAIARTPKAHYIRFGEPRCGPPSPKGEGFIGDIFL